MRKIILLLVTLVALTTAGFAQGKKSTKESPKTNIPIRLETKLFKDLKEIYGLKSQADLEKLVNQLLKEQLDVEEEG